MIPGLNDAELEGILEAAAEAGATSAGYVLVRLPHEVKEIFTAWLEEHYPTKASHVLALVRETHGGKLYDAEWGTRMKGAGPIAELLLRRFEVASRKLGLDRRPEPLDTSLFRAPPDRGAPPRLF